MKFKTFLKQEETQPYYQKLMQFLAEQMQTNEIYPPQDMWFKAFDALGDQDVKVVILGQDPYHGQGEAMGLAFSVEMGVKIPPSLQNIFKELKNDLGYELPLFGDLSAWANQGVLLLNTVLTVRKDEANSHKGKGWEIFTTRVLQELDKQEQPIVFILWGKQAIEKKELLHNPNHLILESVHPSPLSAYRGFFGSKPFSQANAYLKAHGVKEIDWRL
ncbi:uracil-DNA glycosylase [Erysipelotrichaceae bacterium MTC7]|nr:uracil-DNA glycosylase [Erysipelotrichaceae bacterium MTC7]